MVQIYNEFKGDGFDILAFPSNQFGGQEHNNVQKIQLTAAKFGVQFHMMARTDINGKNTHDLYKYLRRNSVLYDEKKNVVREVPWNFTKFLVSGDGKKIRFYNPRVNPIKIAPDIKKYLDKVKKEGRGQDFDQRSQNLSDLDVPSQDPSSYN